MAELLRSLTSVAAVLCCLFSPPCLAADEKQPPATQTGQATATVVKPAAQSLWQRLYTFSWLTDGAASLAASAYLSARTHGPVSARVNTNGLVSLLHGQFNSVELIAHGGRVRGVPFGRVHLTAKGPFVVRYFKKDGKRPGLLAPLMVSVQGELPERTFARALESPKVVDNLRFLKFDLPGLGQQRLQILHPHVELLGNKVRIDSDLLTANAQPDSAIKLRIVARPVLEQDRYIKLRDMQVESDDIRNPREFGFFAEQLFNPLVDFGRYDRLDHALRMDKLEIKDGRVDYAARLLLAPKP